MEKKKGGGDRAGNSMGTPSIQEVGGIIRGGNREWREKPQGVLEQQNTTQEPM